MKWKWEWPNSWAVLAAEDCRQLSPLPTRQALPLAGTCPVLTYLLAEARGTGLQLPSSSRSAGSSYFLL